MEGANFSFSCPHCGQPLEAEADWAGMELDCIYCGKPLTVPPPSPDPSAPPPVIQTIAKGGGETPPIITVVRKREGFFARNGKWLIPVAGVVVFALIAGGRTEKRTGPRGYSNTSGTGVRTYSPRSAFDSLTRSEQLGIGKIVYMWAQFWSAQNKIAEYARYGNSNDAAAAEMAGFVLAAMLPRVDDHDAPNDFRRADFREVGKLTCRFGDFRIPLCRVKSRTRKANCGENSHKKAFGVRRPPYLHFDPSAHIHPCTISSISRKTSSCGMPLPSANSRREMPMSRESSSRSSKASSDSASTRYEAARPFCVMRIGRCVSRTRAMYAERLLRHSENGTTSSDGRQCRSGIFCVVFMNGSPSQIRHRLYKILSFKSMGADAHRAHWLDPMSTPTRRIHE